MARGLISGGPFTLPSSTISISISIGIGISNRKNSRRFYCAARYDNARDASPAIQIVVEGVTQLLRFFSPNKSRDSVDRIGVRGEVPSVSCVEDVLEIIKDDYGQAYFLTGNFTPDIYAEDCLFEDPTIKFRGRDRYGQNLELLLPFFENPSLELDQIQKEVNSETSSILASWKLRTYLKLPWRPLISIKGQTTYNLDQGYKITKHSESWNVSAIEAIGQIFGFQSEDIDV